jgi:hypothetical protein
MNQGGRVKRTLAVLAPELPARQAPQVVVHQGDNTVERLAVPTARGD